MRANKRLARLEMLLAVPSPVALLMPDGAIELFHFRLGEDALGVLHRAVKESETGVFSDDVDLIRRSVEGHERGGFMVEVVRALLTEPADPEEGNEEEIK